MNTAARLKKLEKSVDGGNGGCGHLVVVYGDDGSGADREPEPREPRACCAINRPTILRVVYDSTPDEATK